MRSYTITAGTFRKDDGSLAHPGDTIELEDDVAQLHADKLQPVQATPPASEDQAAA